MQGRIVFVLLSFMASAAVEAMINFGPPPLIQATSGANGNFGSVSVLNAHHQARKEHPICGATTIRLNIAMNKLYGKWYPIEVSEIAYKLWSLSLGVKLNSTTANATNSSNASTFCPVWEFKRSLTTTLQLPTMKIKISDKGAAAVAAAGSNSTNSTATNTTKVDIEAILIGDEAHPGKSKWLISWPTGEDTLTSIVATGSWLDSHKQYDWLLTMDCDVNADESPDWAIFSRRTTLNPRVMAALKAIVDGIQGVDPKDTRAIRGACDKGKIRE